MAISLLSWTDLFLPSILAFVGMYVVLLSVAVREPQPLILGAILGITGGVWFRYLKKHQPMLILAPERFLIRKGRQETEILWNDVVGLRQSARGGKNPYMTLTIQYWNTDRTSSLSTICPLDLSRSVK